MKLKIVTLDNVYLSAENSLARKLFAELILLRAQGYGPEYPKSFLPLDATDYVIWHHLFCWEKNGVLEPIAGFRQVSMKRCDFYGLTVPLLKTALEAAAKDHVLVLNDLFEKNRRNNAECVYSAGLTIKKAHRGDRGLSDQIKELVAALHYADSIERGVDSMVCASILRFKTDRWFTKLGYVPLSRGSEILPPIQKKSAGGEPMLLMQLEKVSDWCREQYLKHAEIMKDRLVLGTTENLNIDAA